MLKLHLWDVFLPLRLIGIPVSSMITNPTSGPIVSKYSSVVDKLLNENVGAEVFHFPTASDIFKASEGMDEKLKFWYDSTFPTQGEDGSLPINIRVYQAMACTGLFYAYDKNRKVLELFTACPDILKTINGGDKFRPDFMYRENAQNIIHAMRIDVEYSNVHGDHTAKAVSLRGSRKLSLSDFIIIPYISVHRFMRMLNQYLERGTALEVVKSSPRGASVVRYLCLDEEAQNHFNGSVVGNSVIDYRFLGKVYVPILSAPTYTMGLTSLHFESIDYLSSVRKSTLAKSLAPADNSPESLIRDQLFDNFIKRVFSLCDSDSQPEKEAGTKVKLSVHRFLRRRGQVDIPVNGSRYDYMRAIRELDPKLSDALYTKLPDDILQIADNLRPYIKGATPVPTPDTVSALRDILRGGIYRVVSMKKDGSFYSTLCSNSPKYLEAAYGDDYYGEYESETYRVRLMGEFMESGMSIQEAARKTGFTEYVTNDDGSPMEDGIALAEYHDMREAVLELGDEGTGRSNDGNVLVRGLFCQEESNFYRYLIPSRIFSITRLD